MLHPDCESLMQTIQSIAKQIEEIDYRISALEAEAMEELDPLAYLVSQPRADRLIKEKHTLQNTWHNAMNEFAICQSVYPAYHPVD